MSTARALALLPLLPLACTQDEAPPRFESRDAVVHRAPKPVPAGALAEDWPGFLGPRRDARSLETRIDHSWSSEGPPLVWEAPRGDGYAQPAVAGERVLHYHRVGDVSRLECRALETGALAWVYEHPCTYRGEIGSDHGPRATPLVHEKTVFVQGVEGTLHAVSLEAGKLLWKRDLASEYATPESWFGAVASPIARGERLYVIAGGEDACVVALDVSSGKELWRAAGEERWSADCASPVLAESGGAARLFALTGGKARPATGGLMVMEPESGRVLHRFPFRSRSATSVNGCSPLVLEDGVFLTASYETGSVFLELPSDGAPRERWRLKDLGVRFSQPLFYAGSIVLVDGVANQTGAIVALDPRSGAERWRLEVDPGRIGEGNLLAVEDRLLLLGDGGDLFRLRAEEKSAAVEARAALFDATEGWTPPVLSHGLLLVCQNEPDRGQKSAPRLLCYDLRAKD